MDENLQDAATWLAEARSQGEPEMLTRALASLLAHLEAQTEPAVRPPESIVLEPAKPKPIDWASLPLDYVRPEPASPEPKPAMCGSVHRETGTVCHIVPGHGGPHRFMPTSNWGWTDSDAPPRPVTREPNWDAMTQANLDRAEAASPKTTPACEHPMKDRWQVIGCDAEWCKRCGGLYRIGSWSLPSTPETGA